MTTHPAMAKPLWSLPRDERARLAVPHVGKQVTLVINPLRRRDPNTWLVTLAGRLVCVASSGTNGTTGEILVIHTDEGRVLWYPLARVQSITEEERS